MANIKEGYPLTEWLLQGHFRLTTTEFGATLSAFALPDLSESIGHSQGLDAPFGFIEYRKA